MPASVNGHADDPAREVSVRWDYGHYAAPKKAARIRAFAARRDEMGVVTRMLVRHHGLDPQQAEALVWGQRGAVERLLRGRGRPPKPHLVHAADVADEVLAQGKNVMWDQVYRHFVWLNHPGEMNEFNVRGDQGYEPRRTSKDWQRVVRRVRARLRKRAAELAGQSGHNVVASPAADVLPPADAVNPDARNRHALAGRCDAHDVVRMNPGPGPAGHHDVSLRRDHVVHHPEHLREEVPTCMASTHCDYGEYAAPGEANRQRAFFARRDQLEAIADMLVRHHGHDRGRASALVWGRPGAIDGVSGRGRPPKPHLIHAASVADETLARGQQVRWDVVHRNFVALNEPDERRVVEYAGEKSTEPRVSEDWQRAVRRVRRRLRAAADALARAGSRSV